MTLAEAKLHLRVEHADDDALISASIQAAREWVEEYLDATLIHMQWQMTLDLFEYKRDDLIEGHELGGAATYIETATKSDINLFI